MTKLCEKNGDNSLIQEGENNHDYNENREYVNEDDIVKNPLTYREALFSKRIALLESKEPYIGYVAECKAYFNRRKTDLALTRTLLRNFRVFIELIFPVAISYISGDQIRNYIVSEFNMEPYVYTKIIYFVITSALVFWAIHSLVTWLDKRGERNELERLIKGDPHGVE